MALITTRKPVDTKWLFKANNHILTFYSDDGGLTTEYAEIVIDGISEPIVIYPNIDDTFWFNFKDYFNVLFERIKDEIDPTGVTNSDIDTFVFDWTKSVKVINVTWKVYHTDTSFVSDTDLLYVVHGVEDLYKHKRGVTKDGLNNHYLTPLSVGSTTRHYARYWHGFPFDIGFTQAIPNVVSPQRWKNLTNGIETPDITTPHACQRMFLSNGDTTHTLEDFMPLVNGYNEIRMPETNNTYVYLDLWKMTESCGVYLKWYNNKGGYSYWLFSEFHAETLNTKGLGMINNDFEELGNTVSPSVSLGREGREGMNLMYENLNADDYNYLKSLFLSQKIYLFTGEPFAKNSFNDWLEIGLSNVSAPPRDFKGRVPRIDFKINLPNPVTTTL